MSKGKQWVKDLNKGDRVVVSVETTEVYPAETKIGVVLAQYGNDGFVTVETDDDGIDAVFRHFDLSGKCIDLGQRCQLRQVSKIDFLLVFLKAALDSDRPRDNLDGVTTLDVVQWVEKELGVTYTPAQVIKALMSFLYELPCYGLGYETKDGVFSYSNSQNVNNRRLPKYIWFFT